MRKITITEIAKLANVSIGTVDRAINNRPGINPKTKEKVLAIAKQHHYQPNRLSKALAHQKTIRIGMITLPETITFVQTLIENAHKETAALSDYGCRLTVKSLKAFDVQEEVRTIRAFIKDKIDALAIAGLDHPDVAAAINQAVERGIPVITFNTDVPTSHRSCFVGQNLYQSGKIAANLLGKFMVGKGNMFILQGSHNVSAHTERLNGFQDVIKTDFPEINLIGIEECFDDEKTAYQKVKDALQAHAEISGIYIVAAGSIGAAKAVVESGRTDISVVCNDYISGMKELLDANVIDATILQDPAMQGSLPIRMLFDTVFDGTKPSQEIFHTAIQIAIKYHDFPENA